jgi:multidrug resistance efflux pump
VLLTEVRSALLRIETDIGAAVEQLRAELAVSIRERRAANEAIARLSRQHTELRRDLKQTELHVPLRHSRKRPLGQ